MKQVEQGRRHQITRLPQAWRSYCRIEGYVDRERRYAVVYANMLGRTKWAYLIDTHRDRIAVECPLTMGRVHGQQCWHPDFTRTGYKYQGQGLAFKLYVYLIRDGVIMRSGRTQSTGSQLLWGKLCDVPGITVYSVPRDGVWYECERGSDGVPDPGDHDPYSDYKTVCFAVAEK